MTRQAFDSAQLKKLSSLEILRLHAALLDELADRGVVRSKNNPIADYAEYIVSKALSLILEGKSNKGFDAVDKKSGRRYEIKCRRKSPTNKAILTSPIRDLEGKHFDELIIVLFAEDYTVKKAIQLPRRLVKTVGKYRKHVNGWVIPLRESLWTTPGCIDITAMIQQAQETE
jgi:hypothetical protein